MGGEWRSWRRASPTISRFSASLSSAHPSCGRGVLDLVFFGKIQWKDLLLRKRRPGGLLNKLDELLKLQILRSSGLFPAFQAIMATRRRRRMSLLDFFVCDLRGMMVGALAGEPRKHCVVELPSEGQADDATSGRRGHSTLRFSRAFSSSRPRCQSGGSSISVLGSSPASPQVVPSPVVALVPTL